MFFLAYIVTFLEEVYFRRNYFVTVNTSAAQPLPQSNQFFGAAFFSLEQLPFSEHLLLLSSYPFKILIWSKSFTDQLLFGNRQFSRAVSFSKEIQEANLQVSLLYLFGFSEQLLFRKANLLRISISVEEVLFRSRYFYKTSNFSEQLFFQQSSSSKEALFQNSYSSRSATFRNSYFFRKAAERTYNFSVELLSESSSFSKELPFCDIFQKRCYIIFYSFTSFPQLHFYLSVSY